MVHLVDLTVALSSRDHTLDLSKGDVSIAGTRPVFVEPAPSPEVPRKWDVSEIPLLAYAMLRAAGDESLTAIPVFTSRGFPHRAIFVRADRIGEPGDLRGAKVGICAWAETTAVWARGVLADTYGVKPDTIEWWEGDLERPGGEAPGGAAAPETITLRQAGEVALLEMLQDGRLDALIAPGISQHLSGQGEHGDLRPLFPEPRAVERAYYEATRCLPPLRTVAIRRELLETRPWIASNLYRAFEVAKRRYFVRLTEISASRTAIPWTSAYMGEVQELFGSDPWPYGTDANRSSLEVFLRYSVEQGLLREELAVEDLFAAVEPFVDGLN